MKFCQLLLKNVKFVVFSAIKPVKVEFWLFTQVIRMCNLYLNMISFDIIGNTNMSGTCFMQLENKVNVTVQLANLTLHNRLQ